MITNDSKNKEYKWNKLDIIILILSIRCVSVIITKKYLYTVETKYLFRLSPFTHSLQ